MAERSKAAVSKTVNGFFPFGGSNPPLSAIFMLKNGHFPPYFPHDIAGESKNHAERFPRCRMRPQTSIASSMRNTQQSASRPMP